MGKSKREPHKPPRVSERIEPSTRTVDEFGNKVRTTSSEAGSFSRLSKALQTTESEVLYAPRAAHRN